MNQLVHDVRDRRHNNMEAAVAAIAGCVADLTAYPGNEGVSYLVADRLARIAVVIEAFRARDLINMRKLDEVTA